MRDFRLRFRVFIASVILFLLAALLGTLASDYFFWRERILPGYYIGNFPLGGLTPPEALGRLKGVDVDALMSAPLYFFHQDEKLKFYPSQINTILLTEEAVNLCYRDSRRGTYFRGLAFRLLKKENRLPLLISFDGERLREVLQSFAGQINAVPQNASCLIDEKTQVLTVLPGIAGKRLEIKKSIPLVERSLKEGKKWIPVYASYPPPKVRTEDITRFPPKSRLSEYTTYYGTHDSPNRIHNIQLVAALVTNTLLMPEEKLSLLKVIGDFSRERGFKEAFVIVGNELVPELGGGSCQIATTLYNAVMLADLEILKRTNHALYFSIYPLGRDATVYPPSTDFIFKNNTGHPLVLQAIATKKKLSFRVYGTPTGKSISFSPPQMKRLPALGELKPFITAVERTVQKDGKTLKTETIRSYYKLHGDRERVKIRRPEPR